MHLAPSALEKKEFIETWQVTALRDRVRTRYFQRKETRVLHACTCFIFPKASWNVSNHSFPVLTVLPVWMTGASSATLSMGSLMFDSTHLKTHHMASILLKKRILHVSSVEQKEA